MGTTAFLKRISLFQDLTPDEIDRIAFIFQEKEFKKNQVVFMEEETGDSMYIVKYGEVKVVQTSLDGRENILAIHHTGDSFGEMALLDGKTLPAMVLAKEDCKIIQISRSNFAEILLKNPKVTRQLLQLLCQRLRDSWQTIRVLKYTDAETKLKHILREFARSDGQPREGGVLINMKVTHQELAEIMGTSRETVSRLISRLQTQGALRFVSRKILLVDGPYWKEQQE